MGADPQSFSVVITSGTNDPIKVHAAIVNGFALRKTGQKVNFVLMAEGGNIAHDTALRGIQAFGLPPMSKLLDDEVMTDAAMVTWTV
jgi:predicted peroxiredoxin